MKLEPKHVVITVLLLAGLLMSVLTASFAYYTNEGFGFPLDDPWIHLQFAKNLHHYGSFSYYKSDIVTSGSTAPLYTFLLAAGFFVTSNEMLLSYALGVGFLLCGAISMYRLSEKLFGDRIAVAAAATLLLVLEPRIQWIALSGMETTLFVFLLLAVVYYYFARRPVPLGICAGLLMWTRPEAVILFGAILANEVYHRFIVAGANKRREEEHVPLRWLTLSTIITALLALSYVAFNFLLSGSLLPNTYAAKVKYYAAGGEDFPAQVLTFLTGGVHGVLGVLAGIGILAVLVDIVKRRESRFLIPLLFSAGMFLAYWMKLPYLYQNGRYLMPILPFVILLGLSGTDVLFRLASPVVAFLASEKAQAVVKHLVFALLVVLSAYGSWDGRTMYQDFCKYITDRQVKTALWVRDHLPKDAIVATHDVGALGYYSERRIVDMVGLISPEMIQNIGDLGKLEESLVRQHVTHLAVLRSWFEVVNINPIYQTNEQKPEVMEVFEFQPARIHITSKRVNWLTNTGWQYLIRGNVQQGGPYVENAVQADPNSSRAHHHFGWALMMVNQFERSELEFRKALELQPDNWRAYFALAQIPLRQGKTQEGIAKLQQLLKLNPSMLVALQQLGQIYQAQGDTAQARKYLDLYKAKMQPNSDTQ